MDPVPLFMVELPCMGPALAEDHKACHGEYGCVHQPHEQRAGDEGSEAGGREPIERRTDGGAGRQRGVRGVTYAVKAELEEGVTELLPAFFRDRRGG